MFTKALILVLLGSSLVVSSPVADPGVIDKIKEWYNSATSKLQDIYQSASNTVNELYGQAKANAAYAKELGEDAAAYLQQQAAKAQAATVAQIDALKAAAGAKIQEVQDAANTGKQVVGYEVDKITSETQNKINQVLDSAKKAWDQEVQNAKEHYANKGQ